MKLKAAKYFEHDGPKSPWQIAFYPADTDPDEEPHDWFLLLSPQEWRSMKPGATPKKDEVFDIELMVTRAGPAKKKRGKEKRHV